MAGLMWFCALWMRGEFRWMEEGDSVVAAAPSLRPSAEWSPFIAHEAARWMGHPAGFDFRSWTAEWSSFITRAR
jgi:hypothetical protein